MVDHWGIRTQIKLQDGPMVEGHSRLMVAWYSCKIAYLEESLPLVAIFQIPCDQ
jgi:hypothetical protein